MSTLPVIRAKGVTVISNNNATECDGTQEKPKRKRRPRFSWKKECADLLIAWLTEPGNYDRWKSTAVPTGPGKTKRVTGDSKRQIAAEIATLLREKGFEQCDGQIVQNKIDLIESSYKKARSCLKGTGFGVDDSDIAKGIKTVEEKVLYLCSYFYQLDPIFADRPSMVPAFLAGTDDADAEVESVLDVHMEQIEEPGLMSTDEPRGVPDASSCDLLNDADFEQSDYVENSEAVKSLAVNAADTGKKVDSGARLAPSLLKSVVLNKTLGGRPRAPPSPSVVESYLAHKKEMFDQKMKLSARKQDHLENVARMAHEAKMAELEVRKLEAEAKKEAAISQRSNYVGLP
ncbi:uncharacterized protein LOC129599355 [Paramacrobiotus metropolitanus]|uniref:uncharacterized protein LOC129599355 n=1 Tax=Paramacrobiotus metropolitanus TaxID=2943436 RepID=UPI00244655A8|nr:uncharacterized protein LOC129599355 [Paramacrobiotus metropolitanus]XP_055353549.1 uncharacterized protein LOC129599355 [Paramacrobiotus metropolitanus]